MVKDNIARVKEKIHLTCKKLSRSPEDITLVCVTKGVAIDKISQAIDCGIIDIGENRIQEATDKYLQLKQLSKQSDKFFQIKWHMVGHLQTNKADKAVEMFNLIQSVDSLRLAKKIDDEAKKNNKTCDILIEVNTSGEASKFGAKEQELLVLAEEISKLKNIRLLGLMTVGPLTADENKIRQSFRSLRELKEKIAKEIAFSNVKMQYLSMGMTDDYQIAIEEGSNMLRLGRAIFADA
jgi:pyridoxal phosphate enzyme (YggS family)